jgi:hypothetical protein
MLVSEQLSFKAKLHSKLFLSLAKGFSIDKGRGAQ